MAGRVSVPALEETRVTFRNPVSDDRIKSFAL